MTESTPVESEPRLRLDDQLCFALYSATGSIVRAYRPLLRDVGLTYPQYVVLMALWEADDVSVGELATRLSLPLNGITPILDRLERLDLLERRRGKEDRRVVKVLLTDAGREIERPAAGIADKIRCQTELAPDAVDDLRTQLRSLTRILDAADPGSRESG